MTTHTIWTPKGLETFETEDAFRARWAAVSTEPLARYWVGKKGPSRRDPSTTQPLPTTPEPVAAPAPKKPRRKRTHPKRICTGTVNDFLDCAEIESLRDEMQEWQSNMEGASMEHLPKYDEVTEAVDLLDNAYDDLDEAVESVRTWLTEHQAATLQVTVQCVELTNKRGLPRWMRLANAIASLNAVVDVLRPLIGGDAASKPAPVRKATLEDVLAACRRAQTEQPAPTDEADEEDDPLDELREHVETIETQIGELESVTFPSMF